MGYEVTYAEGGEGRSIKKVKKISHFRAVFI